MKQGCREGVNNLSDILAVSVMYEFENGRTLEVKNLDIVIKLLPQDMTSRFFVRQAQFDLREIKFYTSVSEFNSSCRSLLMWEYFFFQILPDLLAFQESNITREQSTCMLVSVPTCFYTQYTLPVSPSEESPEQPESILVLEDMRSLGYKVCRVLHLNSRNSLNH